jgi:hypothetical protein
METFETFEALFTQAILWGDIDCSDEPSIKAYNQTFYEWEFSIWLQNNEMWKLESENITRFLTKKNWEQFMGEKALWERRWNKKNEAKPSNKPKYDHSAELLGLFCFVINDSGFDKRSGEETIASYCKRICDRFYLNHREKVRQFFNTDPNSRKLLSPKLKEEILPGLDPPVQELIVKYLEKENLIPERMYG